MSIFPRRLKKQHIFRVSGTVKLNNTCLVREGKDIQYRHTLQVEKLRIHHMLLNLNYLNARKKKRDVMESVIHHGVTSIMCGCSEVIHCEPEQAALKTAGVHITAAQDPDSPWESGIIYLRITVSARV